MMTASSWACPSSIMKDQDTARFQGYLSVMLGRYVVERTHLALQDCKEVGVGISDSVESLDTTSVQEQGDWESRRMQEGRS